MKDISIRKMAEANTGYIIFYNDFSFPVWIVVRSEKIGIKVDPQHFYTLGSSNKTINLEVTVLDNVNNNQAFNFADAQIKARMVESNGKFIIYMNKLLETYATPTTTTPAATSRHKGGGQTSAAPAAPAPAPAAAPTPTPTPTTPAPAAPATEIDSAKVKAGLVILLKLVAGDSLKIMPGGIRAETKVWKGVIGGFGGPDNLADRIIADAAFTHEEERKLALFKAETLKDTVEMKNTDLLSALGKVNNIIYNIKNKSTKRFLGVDLRSERQIAESVKKSLASTSSLHELHTLSKVAARRERAKKSLDSTIEKEASVEDDMTSKVEKRRAAARAKLGL